MERRFDVKPKKLAPRAMKVDEMEEIIMRRGDVPMALIMSPEDGFDIFLVGVDGGRGDGDGDGDWEDDVSTSLSSAAILIRFAFCVVKRGHMAPIPG